MCSTSAAVRFESGVRVLKTLCLYASNGCETAVKVGVTSWRYLLNSLGNRLGCTCVVWKVDVQAGINQLWKACLRSLHVLYLYDMYLGLVSI